MKDPKILLFDLETRPNLSYTWGKWEQNVIDFKEEWSILSYSAKWLSGQHVTKGLCDYPNYRRNKDSDELLVKELWELFDKADIIVAHNGDQFDIKKAHARFTFYGMKPPTPFQTVDTKKIAKKYFNFNSNSLNDLSKYLGFGRKIRHEGFDLWLDCMRGDMRAWRIMKRYNKHDVELLEKIYLHFLPWMSNHPNLSTYLYGEVCPKCGSDKLQSRGFTRTLANIFKRFQCTSCGGWGRYRTSEDKINSVMNI